MKIADHSFAFWLLYRHEAGYLAQRLSVAHRNHDWHFEKGAVIVAPTEERIRQEMAKCPSGFFLESPIGEYDPALIEVIA